MNAQALKQAAKYPGGRFVGALPEIQRNPLEFFVRAGRLGEFVESRR
jgi:hypothetical protein